MKLALPPGRSAGLNLCQLTGFQSNSSLSRNAGAWWHIEFAATGGEFDPAVVFDERYRNLVLKMLAELSHVAGAHASHD